MGTIKCCLSGNKGKLGLGIRAWRKVVAMVATVSVFLKMR